VHASANLPAFRVCFSAYGQYPARPANNTMPQSNLAGVDIGAAVHVGALSQNIDGPADPFDASSDATADGGADASKDAAMDAAKEAGSDSGSAGGTLFVFREASIRGNDQSCTDLLRSKVENADYYAVPLGAEAGAVLAAGQGVALLAVQGCVAGEGATPAACGGDLGAKAHNLRARVIAVPPAATGGELAVQALFLSDSLRTADRVELFFGASPGTSIVDNEAFKGSIVDGNSSLVPKMPKTFTLPETGNVFDSQGFRVETLRAGKSTVVFQSLAQTQALSDALTVPSDYYKLPSNFVVLVLGEDQPGDAAALDPNRALHMLAFPVRDPKTLVEAGAP
jgi:hypothetical protein